ncbi:MAG TPA: hypothetical protein PLU33_09165 [Treponemataceae bacterium]|nr:hypothetical protein [Treponemataceae bacterium]HQL05300.1 hypothetical protein [Treponemataceae bacterium]
MPPKKGEGTSKTTSKTGTVKKTTPKTAAPKTAVKKTTSKTTAVKKTALKGTAKKAPAKSAVKKPAAKASTPKTTVKTPVKKPAAKTAVKASAKTAPVKKPALKETAKKAPAKSAVKKPAAKASTSKTTVKTPVKKAAAKAKTAVKATAKTTPVKKTAAKETVKKAPAAKSVAKKPAAKKEQKKMPAKIKTTRTASTNTAINKTEVKQTAEKTIPKTTDTKKTTYKNESASKTEAKKSSVFDKITGKNIPAPDFTPAEEPQIKTPAAKGSPASLLNAALKAEGFYASGNDLALSVNGKIFTFTWRTGTIIGTRHDRKTEISGGGGSISGHTQNGYGTITGKIDPITTRNTEIISFFLKDSATGVERPYTIYNNDVPIRDGQTMTIASVHHNNKSSIISFCNASSRRWNLALNTIDIAENLGLGKSLHMKGSYRSSLLLFFALVLPSIASSVIMMFVPSWSSRYGIMAGCVVIGLLLYFAKKAQLKAKYAWLDPFKKKLGALSGYLC